MNKKQACCELSTLRTLTYSQWIEFGEYLKDNTDDPVIQYFYKSLSGKFLEQAKVSRVAEPAALAVSVSKAMISAEDRLRESGWK